MIDSRYIFAFSLGAGLTVILMLSIGYQLDGDMGLCKLEAAGSIGETPATCLRSWLSALSGWVAATGAFVIGIPTLAYLRAQAYAPTVSRKVDQIAGTIEHIKTLQFELFNPELSEASFEKPTDVAALNFEYVLTLKSKKFFDVWPKLSNSQKSEIFNEIGYIDLHKECLERVKLLKKNGDFKKHHAEIQYHRFIEELRMLCFAAIDRLTGDMNALKNWEKENLLP